MFARVIRGTPVPKAESNSTEAPPTLLRHHHETELKKGESLVTPLGSWLGSSLLPTFKTVSPNRTSGSSLPCQRAKVSVGVTPSFNT
jgi:hypothetical protein